MRRNIELYCRRSTDKTIASRLSNDYRDLFYCDNDADYKMRLSTILKKWASLKHVHDYVQKQWLIPHRQHLVAAWTDNTFTLGQNTTNRYVHNFIFIFEHMSITYNSFNLTSTFVSIH